jgi:hypothetical protein
MSLRILSATPPKKPSQCSLRSYGIGSPVEQWCA